jgi:NAD(P)-dependent dehydrogenase (short-subunit alcohol dehydrogenase family)
MTETKRVAIVTGAAGGIGRAIVRGLLTEGIQVAGVDRDRQPLEALAASAREQGKADDLLTIQTDLTNDSATDQITKATRGRFGRIDILVNNAGIGPGSVRPDSWQRPLKFWETSVAPLCCRPHNGAVGARECRRARDDAPGLGPYR